MENKKKVKEAVIDFDYIRAINEYMDDSFLNKTLQSLKGGAAPDKKDIVTYKINNTNYLANLYPDPILRGGKKTMLLDSIFKVPENFSLNSNSAVDMKKESKKNLEIGGAKSKSKTTKDNKPKPKPKPKPKSKSKKKGGSDLYEVEYSDVEELGGESANKLSIKKKTKINTKPKK